MTTVAFFSNRSLKIFFPFQSSAYICTTVGTVLAMIVAFLSSQQTFCFIQLRGDEKMAKKCGKNVDQIDSDTILRKVIIL